MAREQSGLTVREFAVSLGIRMGTAYGLLWDGVITGKKDDNGEWLVDRESVERYRLRRALRRASSRNAMQNRAIDVAVTSGV